MANIQSTGRPLSHRNVWSFRVDMIPLRDLVPEWNSRSGTTIGVNTRRGDSRRHDIWWWYHVNKYRAMRGNGSELAPRRKSPRCPPYLLIYGWVFDLKLTAEGKKLFLTWLKQQWTKNATAYKISAGIRWQRTMGRLGVIPSKLQRLSCILISCIFYGMV